LVIAAGALPGWESLPRKLKKPRKSKIKKDAQADVGASFAHHREPHVRDSSERCVGTNIFASRQSADQLAHANLK
jgi:hypothetical protein